MYWQQEWPMLSYSIYVVCSLYVTFLLPLERAPKVLAPSLFFFLSVYPSICMSVCSGQIFSFVIVQYSTVEYSTVQYKAAGPPSRDCSECDYRICSRVNLKTHYQTNCNGCAKRFCGRRHLKTHNTFREAVRLYNILAHSTQ